MKDVTALVEFGLNDDEYLPLYKCVCGKEFNYWDHVISIYPEYSKECEFCHRKLYFGLTIRVYEVEEWK